VRDQHVGREGADRLGYCEQRLAVDLQRVVAEVEAAKRGAQMGSRGLRLGMAQALDVVDRLPLLLPELAGLAAI
jgi:hypothetical protein